MLEPQNSGGNYYIALFQSNGILPGTLVSTTTFPYGWSSSQPESAQYARGSLDPTKTYFFQIFSNQAYVNGTLTVSKLRSNI